MEDAQGPDFCVSGRWGLQTKICRVEALDPATLVYLPGALHVRRPRPTPDKVPGTFFQTPPRLPAPWRNRGEGARRRLRHPCKDGTARERDWAQGVRRKTFLMGRTEVSEGRGGENQRQSGLTQREYQNNNNKKAHVSSVRNRILAILLTELNKILRRDTARNRYWRKREKFQERARRIRDVRNSHRAGEIILFRPRPCLCTSGTTKSHLWM